MKGKSGKSSFIRHWVRLRIDGFRPERLLSQAMAEGLRFSDIIAKDETEIHLTAAAADYETLQTMAKQSYRVTIIGRGGIYSVLHQWRQNKLRLAGVAVFILLFLTQACFVREIAVIGNETIPEDELRAVLKEEGLYEGAVKTFDCNAIEKRLFAEYENIVWAKVVYQGNYVQVEVAEGDLLETELPDRTKPCHLVAEQDCYIENVYTYRGRKLVEEGEFAKKGTILISGCMPVEHPSYPLEKGDSPVHYVHAEGEITARIPYYFSFYVKPDCSEAEMEAQVRQWMKKNVPEKAEILNKDFHFDQKKNIIKLYGIIETRQQVGVEKEIRIDERQVTGNEKDTD